MLWNLFRGGEYRGVAGRESGVAGRESGVLQTEAPSSLVLSSFLSGTSAFSS